MRCLFCGKRLALLRKLTDGEFCSTAHRKRYLEEEQKLALARLIEEQHRTDQRQAPQQPAPIVRREQGVQEPADFRGMGVSIRSQAFSPWVLPLHLEESTRACMVERHGQMPVFSRSLAMLETAALACRESTPAPVASLAAETSPDGRFSPPLEPQRAVPPAGSAAEPKPAGLTALTTGAPKPSARVSARRTKTSVFLKLAPPVPPEPVGLPQAQPAPASLVVQAPPTGAEAGLARSIAGELRIESPVPALSGPQDSGLTTTGIALERASVADRLDSSELLAPAVRGRLLGIQCPPLRTRWNDLAQVAFPAALSYPSGGRARRQVEPPAAAGIRRELVPTGAAVEGLTAEVFALESATGRSWLGPARSAAAPKLMLVSAEYDQPARMIWRLAPVLLANPSAASFLPATAHPEPPTLWTAALRRGLESTASEPLPVAVPAGTRSVATAPILSLPEAICPTYVGCFRASMRPCFPPVKADYLTQPSAGAIADRLVASLEPFPVNRRETSWCLSAPRQDPAPAMQQDLFTLGHTLGPRRQASCATESSAPVQLSRAAVVPRLRIETTVPDQFSRASKGTAEPAPTPSAVGPWMAAPKFWKMAPADLKWISLALPAILLVAVISAVGWLPSKPVQSSRVAATSPQSSSLENVMMEKWASLQRNIGSRAAINLQDDFRSGLAEWEGKGNWAADWNYDPAGFILTGPLAIYRPSKELTDYRFEFLGQIDKKSLNWVFRSADYNNYYAMKIVLLKSAPLPTAAIVRYAVIGGKQDKPVQSPLPLAVRSDMFYRVRVEVRGENFTTTVQGQVVDFWSDGRLSHGGVGFFSEKGERARLRWMEVSHQYDALGRLCALLAPYNIQSGNGSLNRQ